MITGPEPLILPFENARKSGSRASHGYRAFMDAYRIANSNEKTCCEEYDELIGPCGFSCVLTEPEDRNWYRDGREVVDELNWLHGLIRKVIQGDWSITEMQEAIGDV